MRKLILLLTAAGTLIGGHSQAAVIAPIGFDARPGGCQPTAACWDFVSAVGICGSRARRAGPGNLHRTISGVSA
jgi:hypothetical protein